MALCDWLAVAVRLAVCVSLGVNDCDWLGVAVSLGVPDCVRLGVDDPL